MQFYRAFEDKHRGSHETIKQRLQVYLPFILPLLDLYEDCRALDVGCGRGEWLETLVENGFNATGVDLDDGMLEACKARQLPAEKADALSYLRAMPSESLSVLTGFHIVEHIPFDDLKALVLEANRVLKSGGLLILETPNAENLIVGTQNFYLDPTHEKPIPHMLLEFLVSFSGFSRSKLLRLQENPALADSPSAGLMDVIGGTSPDYAIVAQKDSGSLDMSAFDPAFEAEYGLSMEELAQRFECNQAGKLSELEQRVEQGQMTKLEELAQRVESNQAGKLNELEQRVEQSQMTKLDDFEQRVRDHQNDKLVEQNEILLNASASLNGRLDYVEREYSAMTEQVQEVKDAVSAFKLDKLKTSNASLETANTSLEFANTSLVKLLDESSRNAHMWYVEAENRLQQIQALKEDVVHKDNRISALAADHHFLSDYIRQLKSSTSWRLTGPMRRSVILSRALVTSPSQTLRRVIKRMLKGVLNRPVLRKSIKRILSRFPTVQNRFQTLATRLRAEAAVPQTVQYAEPTPSYTPDLSDVPPPPAHFTENAKAIYKRLNSNEQRKDLN